MKEHWRESIVAWFESFGEHTGQAPATVEAATNFLDSESSRPHPSDHAAAAISWTTVPAISPVAKSRINFKARFRPGMLSDRKAKLEPK